VDYGRILSEAWRIVRTHRSLWVFGFLAALSSGATSGFNIQGNLSGVRFDEGGLGNVSPEMLTAIGGLACLLGLVMAVLLTTLSTMGQVGLVRGTIDADEGATSLPFGGLWSASVPYFWRMLIINIASFVLFIALMIGVVILTIGLAITVVGLICLLPLICVLVPAAFVFYWWIELARVALVNDGLPVGAALASSWRLVREQFGPVVVMGIVLGLVYLALSFLGFCAFLLLMIPLGIGASLGDQTGQVAGVGMAVAGACVILPIIIVVASIAQAWTGSSWTLFYRRLRPAAAPLSDVPPPYLPAAAAYDSLTPPGDVPPPADPFAPPDVDQPPPESPLPEEVPPDYSPPSPPPPSRPPDDTPPEDLPPATPGAFPPVGP
jgi:hypothetical protein